MPAPGRGSIPYFLLFFSPFLKIRSEPPRAQNLNRFLYFVSAQGIEPQGESFTAAQPKHTHSKATDEKQTKKAIYSPS